MVITITTAASGWLEIGVNYPWRLHSRPKPPSMPPSHQALSSISSTFPWCNCKLWAKSDIYGAWKHKYGPYSKYFAYSRCNDSIFYGCLKTAQACWERRPPGAVKTSQIRNMKRENKHEQKPQIQRTKNTNTKMMPSGATTNNCAAQVHGSSSKPRTSSKPYGSPSESPGTSLWSSSLWSS